MNTRDFRRSQFAPQAELVMKIAMEATLMILKGDEGRLQLAIFNLLSEHGIQDAYHKVVAQSTPYAKYVYEGTISPLGIERPDRIENARVSRAFLEEQRNVLEEIIQILSELYAEVADEETDEKIRDRFDTFIGKMVRIQTALKVSGRITTKFRTHLRDKFWAAVGDA